MAFDDPKSELMHYYEARKKVQNPYVNVILPNGTWDCSTTVEFGELT